MTVSSFYNVFVHTFDGTCTYSGAMVSAIFATGTSAGKIGACFANTVLATPSNGLATLVRVFYNDWTIDTNQVQFLPYANATDPRKPVEVDLVAKTISISRKVGNKFITRIVFGNGVDAVVVVDTNTCVYKDSSLAPQFHIPSMFAPLNTSGTDPYTTTNPSVISLANSSISIATSCCIPHLGDNIDAPFYFPSKFISGVNDPTDDGTMSKIEGIESYVKVFSATDDISAIEASSGDVGANFYIPVPVFPTHSPYDAVPSSDSFYGATGVIQPYASVSNIPVGAGFGCVSNVDMVSGSTTLSSVNTIGLNGSSTTAVVFTRFPTAPLPSYTLPTGCVFYKTQKNYYTTPTSQPTGKFTVSQIDFATAPADVRIAIVGETQIIITNTSGSLVTPTIIKYNETLVSSVTTLGVSAGSSLTPTITNSNMAGDYNAVKITDLTPGCTLTVMYKTHLATRTLNSPDISMFHIFPDTIDFTGMAEVSYNVATPTYVMNDPPANVTTNITKYGKGLTKIQYPGPTPLEFSLDPITGQWSSPTLAPGYTLSKKKINTPVFFAVENEDISNTASSLRGVFYFLVPSITFPQLGPNGDATVTLQLARVNSNVNTDVLVGTCASETYQVVLSRSIYSNATPYLPVYSKMYGGMMPRAADYPYAGLVPNLNMSTNSEYYLAFDRWDVAGNRTQEGNPFRFLFTALPPVEDPSVTIVPTPINDQCVLWNWKTPQSSYPSGLAIYTMQATPVFALKGDLSHDTPNYYTIPECGVTQYTKGKLSTHLNVQHSLYPQKFLMPIYKFADQTGLSSFVVDSNNTDGIPHIYQGSVGATSYIDFESNDFNYFPLSYEESMDNGITWSEVDHDENIRTRNIALDASQSLACSIFDTMRIPHPGTTHVRVTYKCADGTTQRFTTMICQILPATVQSIYNCNYWGFEIPAGSGQQIYAVNGYAVNPTKPIDIVTMNYRVQFTSSKVSVVYLGADSGSVPMRIYYGVLDSRQFTNNTLQFTTYPQAVNATLNGSTLSATIASSSFEKFAAVNGEVDTFMTNSSSSAIVAGPENLLRPGATPSAPPQQFGLSFLYSASSNSTTVSLNLTQPPMLSSLLLSCWFVANPTDLPDANAVIFRVSDTVIRPSEIHYMAKSEIREFSTPKMTSVMINGVQYQKDNEVYVNNMRIIVRETILGVITNNQFDSPLTMLIQSTIGTNKVGTTSFTIAPIQTAIVNHSVDLFTPATFSTTDSSLVIAGSELIANPFIPNAVREFDTQYGHFSWSQDENPSNVSDYGTTSIINWSISRTNANFSFVEELEECGSLTIRTHNILTVDPVRLADVTKKSLDPVSIATALGTTPVYPLKLAYSQYNGSTSWSGVDITSASSTVQLVVGGTYWVYYKQGSTVYEIRVRIVSGISPVQYLVVYTGAQPAADDYSNTSRVLGTTTGNTFSFDLGQVEEFSDVPLTGFSVTSQNWTTSGIYNLLGLSPPTITMTNVPASGTTPARTTAIIGNVYVHGEWFVLSRNGLTFTFYITFVNNAVTITPSTLTPNPVAITETATVNKIHWYGDDFGPLSEAQLCTVVNAQYSTLSLAAISGLIGNKTFTDLDHTKIVYDHVKTLVKLSDDNVTISDTNGFVRVDPTKNAYVMYKRQDGLKINLYVWTECQAANTPAPTPA